MRYPKPRSISILANHIRKFRSSQSFRDKALISGTKVNSTKVINHICMYPASKIEVGGFINKMALSIQIGEI